ncbi:MAG: hypothetical protein AAGU21_10295 [Solidesulfovibrio sp.]|uniref:hypothetical protein n=1 Tax=Desulfovibrionaceae TaxID=194924 RepID=UPI001FAE3D41|nr:hypothetical protein [Fundidesulfovibrio agrisoli]
MSNDNKPNISVTGGPGKPHNSDDTSSTSSTGGTGGTGYTGGSGASGFGGGLGGKISSILDIEEGVDTFARNVAGTGLYGATGGQGQPGSIGNIPKDKQSLAALGQRFSDQVNKINSIDKIVEELNTCQTTLDLVLEKTNAVNAFYAFMQGKRLLRLKALRTEKQRSDWQTWIHAKLPNIKKRSREKYMNLANVPMVETHLEYGVERLAEFGSLYASKSDTEQKKMGLDPLKSYLEGEDFDLEEASYDERVLRFNAILEVKALNRLNLEFPLDVMVSFLRKQASLTPKERKHLVKLGKEEAVKLLEWIIVGDLERKNFIGASDNSETSSQGSSADASSGNASSGPNIEQQVLTLYNSLESIATQGIKLDTTVDRDHLIKLRDYIDRLLTVGHDVQDAQSVQEVAA